MKRFMSFVLVVGLLAVSAGLVHAALTDTGEVRVTIVEESLSLEVEAAIGTTINFGLLVQGTTVMSDTTDDERMSIKNLGATTIDVGVNLTNPANMSAGTSQAENTFVLQAVFFTWNLAPLATNYEANDVITTSPVTASSTYFAADDWTSPGDKGYEIAYEGTRSVKFRLQAPTSLTSGYGTEQVITITFTAVAS